jgi:hypothetical protein
MNIHVFVSFLYHNITNLDFSAWKRAAVWTSHAAGEQQKRTTYSSIVYGCDLRRVYRIFLKTVLNTDILDTWSKKIVYTIRVECERDVSQDKVEDNNLLYVPRRISTDSPRSSRPWPGVICPRRGDGTCTRRRFSRSPLASRQPGRRCLRKRGPPFQNKINVKEHTHLKS